MTLKGGCCNENLWCDGDPSFREQPIVSQFPNSTQVNITWSEAYIHLVKCVDYFFVKYAPTDADHNQIGDKSTTYNHEFEIGGCNQAHKVFTKHQVVAS